MTTLEANNSQKIAQGAHWNPCTKTCIRTCPYGSYLNRIQMQSHPFKTFEQKLGVQVQQNALLNAVPPLLLLLQNLPLQVDQLESCFSETIPHAMSNLETGIDGIKIPPNIYCPFSKPHQRLMPGPGSMAEKASSTSCKCTIGWAYTSFS